MPSDSVSELRYFYCAQCEGPVDSVNGEHFKQHNCDLGLALRARMAQPISERQYRYNMSRAAKDIARLRAYDWRIKHLLDGKEAWRIVVDVWTELKLDHDKKHPYGLQFLWPRIKDGGRKNRRFYRALQTVLLDDPNRRIHLAGAPTGTGERYGIFFSWGREQMHSGPKLWVHFNIEDEQAVEKTCRVLT